MKKNDQNILDSNLQESVAKFELSNEWIFQQNNDPKPIARSTTKWLTEHKTLKNWNGQASIQTNSFQNFA